VQIFKILLHKDNLQATGTLSTFFQVKQEF
jgi:hypothetical protein